jgi:hypothetical protein
MTHLASQVCQKLISLGNTAVSAICADLARAHDYRDVRARLSLVRTNFLELPHAPAFSLLLLQQRNCRLRLR